MEFRDADPPLDLEGAIPFVNSSSPSFPTSSVSREASVSFPRADETEPLPACRVRPATALDLREVSDILARSFHSDRGWNGWLYPLLRLGIYEDLRHRLREPSPPYLCLVAAWVSPTDRQRTEELAGTVELSLKTQPTASLDWMQYPYVSNLAVEIASRRRGIAKRLLETCERQAIEWGFLDIYLHVLEDNARARSLYDKLGYRVRRVESTLGSMWFGQPRRLFLHKRLSRRSPV
ncbi:GCN5-related N-acetyltransferase [Geitlerinema sp. FC II]|nr:GNAT family N-acetyltransferase [Geitlerinema sp. CS-897]PPT07107.1 GCN5-related N-acetyltransferase [Geitlerinema sp. FC II]